MAKTEEEYWDKLHTEQNKLGDNSVIHYPPQGAKAMEITDKNLRQSIEKAIELSAKHDKPVILNHCNVGIIVTKDSDSEKIFETHLLQLAAADDRKYLKDKGVKLDMPKHPNGVGHGAKITSEIAFQQKGAKL